MVFVGLAGVFVGAEAFVAVVVVGVGFSAAPVSSAFDAEVVVGDAGQATAAGSAFEQALGEGDAGGDVVAFHLADCEGAIFVYVVLVCCVASLGAESAEEEQHYYGE